MKKATNSKNRDEISKLFPIMQEHFGQSMNLARIKLMALLLKTLVVHHIATMLPVKQLHHTAGTAHKNIHITIRRVQTQHAHLTAQSVHALAHVRRMLRHHDTITLIQIKHDLYCFLQQRSLLFDTTPRRPILNGYHIPQAFKRLADIISRGEGVWMPQRIFYIIAPIALFAIFAWVIYFSFWIYFHWIV